MVICVEKHTVDLVVSGYGITVKYTNGFKAFFSAFEGFPQLSSSYEFVLRDGHARVVFRLSRILRDKKEWIATEGSLLREEASEYWQVAAMYFDLLANENDGDLARSVFRVICKDFGHFRAASAKNS